MWPWSSRIASRKGAWKPHGKSKAAAWLVARVERLLLVAPGGLLQRPRCGRTEGLARIRKLSGRRPPASHCSLAACEHGLEARRPMGETKRAHVGIVRDDDMGIFAPSTSLPGCLLSAATLLACCSSCVALRPSRC